MTESPGRGPGEIVTHQLANGLTLLLRADPRVPTVYAQGVFRTGLPAQTSATAGINTLHAALLTKGTATRSAEDIAQAIDSIGGQLDAFTAKEYASYYIKVLDEHLPLAVDLLSDIVLRPRVDSAFVDPFSEIPTLVLLKDRKPVARLEGRASAPQIEKLVSSHLEPGDAGQVAA